MITQGLYGNRKTSKCWVSKKTYLKRLNKEYPKPTCQCLLECNCNYPKKR